MTALKYCVNYWQDFRKTALSNLKAQHYWQAESASNSSDWLNSNVRSSGCFVSFTESRSVTDRCDFSGHLFHWYLSDSIRTFSTSWSIKNSLPALLCWSCLGGGGRHYLIKSSNSDGSDRFIPPERQQSKVSL